MADWYTKTVLTVIAICLSFLAGREALAPSRNYETLKIVGGLSDVSRSIAGLDYETSKIVTGLSDLGQSSAGLDKTNPIQKVAICDNWGNVLYLNKELNTHCVALFMGIEEILHTIRPEPLTSGQRSGGAASTPAREPLPPLRQTLRAAAGDS